MTRRERARVLRRLSCRRRRRPGLVEGDDLVLGGHVLGVQPRLQAAVVVEHARIGRPRAGVVHLHHAGLDELLAAREARLIGGVDHRTVGRRTEASGRRAARLPRRARRCTGRTRCPRRTGRGRRSAGSRRRGSWAAPRACRCSRWRSHGRPSPARRRHDGRGSSHAATLRTPMRGSSRRVRAQPSGAP